MGTARYSGEFKRDAVALVESSGRRVSAVARELGVNPESLRQWVARSRAQAPSGAGGEGPLTPAEREELRRLRGQVRGVGAGEGDPAEGGSVFCQGDGPMTGRWRFISDHRDLYGVQRLCRVLSVSASGFYRWIRATPVRVARKAADEVPAGRIEEIHGESNGAYGVPRITRELRERHGAVNHKRVARLMRERGLAGRRLRRTVRTTIADRTVPPAPDLVGRVFAAPAPDVRWCGDITYLPVGGSWMYLATVIDMHSRRVVGWSLAEHMRAGLVVDAVRSAVAARGGDVRGVLFHSDRGAQYTSAAFAEVCRAYGIRRSMGRVGSSYDNAMAESFFATLKRELLYGSRWLTRPQARMAVFAWMAWYNHRRRHSALGYRSPVDYERQHARPVTNLDLVA
ncbi:IS3 family transposase [Kitasatospora sp. MMS16-BH015]|uniref:IS3 family transposase n=1 Tax=Kitasatospora sp. MMS16-BH015 TaxID=2018025 RepID=UPI000CF23EF6|nr:IS3 family transposase [Kitasatospora sp. MMS16-BH015]